MATLLTSESSLGKHILAMPIRETCVFCALLTEAARQQYRYHLNMLGLQPIFTQDVLISLPDQCVLLNQIEHNAFETWCIRYSWHAAIG